MSAAAEAPPPCASRRAEPSRPRCISQPAEPNRLTQAGAAAVEVAAEHTDARAPGDWRGAPPRSALDARACQPLPQVRGALARVGQQIAEAACQRGAHLDRRAESGACGALKGLQAGMGSGALGDVQQVWVGTPVYIAQRGSLGCSGRGCLAPPLAPSRGSGPSVAPVPAPRPLPCGLAVLSRRDMGGRSRQLGMGPRARRAACERAARRARRQVLNGGGDAGSAPGAKWAAPAGGAPPSAANGAPIRCRPSVSRQAAAAHAAVSAAAAEAGQGAPPGGRGGGGDTTPRKQERAHPPELLRFLAGWGLPTLTAHR